MFKNYFKTAWQNLRSHTSYLVINAVGLAVSIAACILIFLLTRFETNFDNFHQNKERIYRVVSATKTPNGIAYSGGSALPLAEALRTGCPQLEQVARTYLRDNQQVTVLNGIAGTPERKFKASVFFAEPAFFKLFNFPFLAGEGNAGSSEKNTAVLTREMAEKYFGGWQTAIGKFLMYDNDRNKICKITGILQNIPANTDFPLQIILSFKTAKGEDGLSDWSGQDGALNTFVLLPKKYPAEQFNNDLKTIVKTYAPAAYANHGYLLQPLSSMHFQREFGTYAGSTFSREMITALRLTGVFLLFIACINFINLATARAAFRSKEVAVRKVLGSSKTQLIIQFLSETLLITVLSVMVALVMVAFALPLLNRILGVGVDMQADGPLSALLLSIIIIVTLLSGLYPAFVLSGFNPIDVMKSRLGRNHPRGISLRRGLVVLQFTVSQILVIGTLVVVGQMKYFQNADLGFDKDGIITVPLANDSARVSKMNDLKVQLLKVPGINSVSLSSFSPMDKASWGGEFKFNNAAAVAGFEPDFKWADADFFTTYHIPFIAGRPYYASDTINGFVVNELMLKKLGISYPGSILGKKLSIFNGSITAPVVGVVKNFNGSSLKEEMKPVMLGSWKLVYRSLNIKIQPGRTKETLAAIERLWNNTYPDFVFEYQFLDDKIANFYKKESRLSQLFKITAGMALFISCLGLYGFVSFMAVQRTKEVGIRKVLGASVVSIVYLFSREITGLMGVAFLVATPLAYLVMHLWLQQYAYRIDIGVILFLAAILISTAVAWLAVGYRAVRAAIANPVASLRSE